MGRNERHAIPEHAELFGGTVADAHAWQFNWGSFAWTEQARDTLSLMPSLLPPDEDCRTSELVTSGEPA